jgi:hypothetical protein
VKNEMGNPIARGLEAIASGFSLRYPDDEENLSYNSLYTTPYTPGAGWKRPRDNNRFDLPINERLYNMHRLHNKPSFKNGPQSTVGTIH